MKVVVFCVAVISFASAGIIHQDSDEGSHHDHHEHEHFHEHEHDHRPTSYQNIHIKHYHPVPTFIKKEYKHLLEHPVEIGKSSSSLEVHHGGKHDHGYAFSSGKQSFGGFEGHEQESEHEGGGFGQAGDSFGQDGGSFGQDGGSFEQEGASYGQEGGSNGHEGGSFGQDDSGFSGQDTSGGQSGDDFGGGDSGQEGHDQGSQGESDGGHYGYLHGEHEPAQQYQFEGDGESGSEETHHSH